MGWATGTGLFDDVLDAIFSIHTPNTVALVKAVEAVIKAFEGHDADCLLETKHGNRAAFCQAWLNLYPDKYYYDNELKCVMWKDDDND